MTNLRIAMRSTFLLAGLAVLFAAHPQAATAAPQVRCTGEPFSFTDLQTTQFVSRAKFFNIAWLAAGMTTLDCGGGSILAIDVWEHAYLAVPSRDSGRTNGVGRVQLAVSVPDGGTLLLGGIIRASTQRCEDAICVIDAEVRANGRGGGTLRMLQRMTIDRQTRMVVGVDVARIVIEFTGAG